MKKLSLAVTFLILLLAVSGCSAPSEQKMDSGDSTQVAVTDSGENSASVVDTAGQTPIGTENETPTVSTAETVEPAEHPEQPVVQEAESTQQTAPETPGTEQSAEAPVQSESAESSGFGVIAKSNNPVSNTEKDEIFNQLDKEINTLMSSIDKMDEVQEADLQAE